jgi:hypothetical protein
MFEFTYEMLSHRLYGQGAKAVRHTAGKGYGGQEPEVLAGAALEYQTQGRVEELGLMP